MKRLILLIVIGIIISSCYDDQGGCTCEQANNYNSINRYDDGTCIYDDCNISVSTGDDFNIQISGMTQNQDSFNIGEQLIIEMTSPIYSFGQAESVGLYLNETLVYSFGIWVYFGNNMKEITIPNVLCSDCYTIRVFNSVDEVYISDSFVIR